MIKQDFDNLLNGLQEKLGIDIYDMDNLFSASSAPGDVEATYDGGLWTYSGKFVDFSWVIQGVDYFRPYIRGFIVLLLVFFNVRQALSMFGLSSGEITGAYANKVKDGER